MEKSIDKKEFSLNDLTPGICYKEVHKKQKNNVSYWVVKHQNKKEKTITCAKVAYQQQEVGYTLEQIQAKITSGEWIEVSEKESSAMIKEKKKQALDTKSLLEKKVHDHNKVIERFRQIDILLGEAERNRQHSLKK